MLTSSSPAVIRHTVRALTILTATAVLPTLATNTRETAERFTHVVGVNLADLPSFDELASEFGSSPVSQSGDAVERGRKNGYSQGDPEQLRHWDIGITLSASFTQGHLTSFRVDRVETN
ncbi:MAG: hypothetical protein QOE55_7089 [Acidobacteriaceae bacterium]|jgi:hypothetical protein|nr:hypothetical protein [Acidobacteriaceae bacterium]